MSLAREMLKNQQFIEQQFRENFSLQRRTGNWFCHTDSPAA
jgi:hypothetical protein